MKWLKYAFSPEKKARTFQEMSEEERMKKEKPVKLTPERFSNNYQVTLTYWSVKTLVELTKYHDKSKASHSFMVQSSASQSVLRGYQGIRDQLTWDQWMQFCNGYLEDYLFFN